jgi:hypothetical protein
MTSGKARIAAWGNWASIIGLAGLYPLVVSAIQFVKGLMKPQVGFPTLFGLPRVLAILVIGLAAAAAHGILWSSTEKIFGWRHRAGGRRSLPEGWSAVLQSLTITIPLATLPTLFSWLFHIQIVPHGHLIASCCMIAAAAIGHLILYGVTSLKILGFRRMVFPLKSPPNLPHALTMELIYAVIHFSSIVLIYRFVLELESGQFSASPFFPAFISASLWLIGVSVFILLMYPESLTNKNSIETRGVINGLMLLLTLQGGMMM